MHDDICTVSCVSVKPSSKTEHHQKEHICLGGTNFTLKEAAEAKAPKSTTESCEYQCQHPKEEGSGIMVIKLEKEESNQSDYDRVQYEHCHC